MFFVVMALFAAMALVGAVLGARDIRRLLAHFRAEREEAGDDHDADDDRGDDGCESARHPARARGGPS